MQQIIWLDLIEKLILIVILILLVALFVFSLRVFNKRSQQMDKKSMISIIIDVVLILIGWYVLERIGVNTAYVVPTLIEWATKFILPWIVLYWMIRWIKSYEKR